MLGKFKGLPFVGDVRYLGLIGAIELVSDKRVGLEIYKRV